MGEQNGDNVNKKTKTPTISKPNQFVGKVNSISSFMEEIAKHMGNQNIVNAIDDVFPLLKSVSEAASESLRLIKFLTELIAKRKQESDPDKLGHLACTTAFQVAMRRAVSETPEPANGTKKISQTVKEKLEAKAKEISSKEFSAKFKHFTRNQTTGHPFIKDIEGLLEEYLEAFGYDDSETRKIILRTRFLFDRNLDKVLFNKKTYEHFRPFTEQMLAGAGEWEMVQEALIDHAHFQRRLFEEKPLFGKYPFSLMDVYIETECKKWTWAEYKDTSETGKNHTTVTPKGQYVGKPELLLQHVMLKLKSSKTKDAIIIMGAAGSGKSSFTLRLCTKLIEEGLIPIRVLMQDLLFNIDIEDAILKAIQFPILEERACKWPIQDIKTALVRQKNKIFNQTIHLGNTMICPYVFIMDGWDDLETSYDKSFADCLGLLLNKIYYRFLHPSEASPVRVILTGRPSRAIAESGFLKQDTPVFVPRRLHSKKLRQLILKLKKALEQSPLENKNSEIWSMPVLSHFEGVVESYNTYCETGSGKMEIMGLPLLATLAIRLISDRNIEEIPLIIQNATALYRNLLDMTCEKAGKYKDDETATNESVHKLFGVELRKILWETAFVLTELGKKRIPHSTLECHLKMRKDESGQEHDFKPKQVVRSLANSFYFDTGYPDSNFGFLHRTFREYLFAEGIVETLKQYGREEITELQRRPGCWCEFPPTSPQEKIKLKLIPLLSAQWFSLEIASHIEQLLQWELGRLSTGDQEVYSPNEMAPLPLENWKFIRDTLADLWEWWADGTHLRLQRPGSGDKPELKQCYAHELVQVVIHENEKRIGTFLTPPHHSGTIDAHLGDGLFRLTALVHYYIAVHEGWEDTTGNSWKDVNIKNDGVRAFQVLVKGKTKQWTLFAPSGNYKKKRPEDSSTAQSEDFSNYFARLNSVGGRTKGWELSKLFLKGIYLENIRLEGLDLSNANLYKVCFHHASLRRINLKNADLSAVDMTDADLSGSDLTHAKLQKASLRNAKLMGADLNGAILHNADFYHATFRGANFSGANLENADLSHCDFLGAELNNAINPHKATWDGAVGVDKKTLQLLRSLGTNPLPKMAPA